MGSGRHWALPAVALLGSAAVVLGSLAADRTSANGPANVIDGPYARLLAESVDLGPARSDSVQLTAALSGPGEPVRLTDWAGVHGLGVRWRPGDGWAILEGHPQEVSDAFNVAVHDYRTRGGADEGRVFYASPQQPEIPEPLRGEVGGLGRILSYTPHREGLPPTPPRDVPDGGLLPTQLGKAYNMSPLTEAG